MGTYKKTVVIIQHFVALRLPDFKASNAMLILVQLCSFERSLSKKEKENYRFIWTVGRMRHKNIVLVTNKTHACFGIRLGV